MVVLWGLMEDGPLAAVARSLRVLGAPVTFIDQRRVMDYAFELTNNGTMCGRIEGPDFSLDLSCARSIYVRQYNFTALDVFEGIDRSSKQWMQAAQFEDLMLLWCDLADACVVNRPSAMASNGS